MLPLWERVSLPVDANDPGAAVYLDMLTRVLEDGLISTVEYSRLDAIAEVAHLSRDRLSALHSEYLAAARAEALADRIVSDQERLELNQIATILDQAMPDLPSIDSVASRPNFQGDAHAPGQKPREQGSVPSRATDAVFALVPGARVVFTGTMSRPREAWARAIADAGFVTGSVTKNCVVLVAEDPASQSGKAKTARAHGIPIVTEAEFISAFDAFILQNGLVG